MKLPALPVCHLSGSVGNLKQMTVMGEVLTEELSDRGSTPLRSTQKSLDFAKIEAFLFHGNDVGIGIEF